MKNKQLLTIFLVVFMDLLGFGIILPLLPYIGEKYGANPFIIGLLTASYSLFQLISSPILGRLSDRYGRKKLLILSQAGSTIGYLIMATSATLPMLFISRIIDGATGGNISIAQAYISDITTKNNRAKAMGFIGAAFGLGFIFGPAIGGFLSAWSFQAPAYFAACVSFITVISTLVFLDETVDVKKASMNERKKYSIRELNTILHAYSIRLFIVVFFTLNFAFSILQGNFALWTEYSYGFGPRQTGTLFTYIGIISVIMQLRVLPYILQRFGEKKLFVFSPLILSAGLILLVFSTHPILLIIPITLIPIGNAIANPVIQALATENVPPYDYGVILGILMSSGSLGRIGGPIFGGYLFETFNKDIPFILSSIIMLGVYLYLKRHYRTIT